MKLCGFEVGLDQPFFLIAGPCVIESEQLQLDVAGKLKEITGRLGIPFIFKGITRFCPDWMGAFISNSFAWAMLSAETRYRSDSPNNVSPATTPWKRGSRGVEVGAGVSVGPGVSVGGSVSEGSGVQVGVFVMVGGSGVVVGMKAAMTTGAWLRKANQLATRPPMTSKATIQKSSEDRVSRTSPSKTAGTISSAMGSASVTTMLGCSTGVGTSVCDAGLESYWTSG